MEPTITTPESPYIFVFGLGFLMGYVLSIVSLDKVYKKIMKRAIDEIHSQYKKILKEKKYDQKISD